MALPGYYFSTEAVGCTLHFAAPILPLGLGWPLDYFDVNTSIWGQAQAVSVILVHARTAIGSSWRTYVKTAVMVLVFSMRPELQGKSCLATPNPSTHNRSNIRIFQVDNTLEARLRYPWFLPQIPVPLQSQVISRICKSSPIWGKPPQSYTTTAQRDALLSAQNTFLCILFEC